MKSQFQSAEVVGKENPREYWMIIIVILMIYGQESISAQFNLNGDTLFHSTQKTKTGSGG